MQQLINSILKTDSDRDHYVGDSELLLLSHRLESIEGVPFTSDEMCERFRRGEGRSLRDLADTARGLYVEKRREEATVWRELSGEYRKSPRNLGQPLLWKRKFDYVGIAA